MNINFANADAWYSMNRHGYCAPFSLVAENIKEFRNISTPKQLIENYIQSGKQAKMDDINDIIIKRSHNMTEQEKNKLPPNGSAYQITVNGNVSWVLLKKKSCSKFL